MKRMCRALLVFLFLLGLCGCARLIPSEYRAVSPHTEEVQPVLEDALQADSFASLKNAIRTLVQNGVEHGLIRVTRYEGDLQNDLVQAAYEVSREDPIGAYAVDYMTHDCALIVSYYEIRIDITFREMRTPLEQLEYVASERELKRKLYQALDLFQDHLTLYAIYPTEPDYEAVVRSYCEQTPEIHVAVPEVRVTEYPASGANRIVELVFTYPEEAAVLRRMQRDIADTVSAADVYVRYRSTAGEKAALLYSYLAERFSYTQGTSRTPVYSALCQGVADSASMAYSWKLLCDQLGMECRLVQGFRGSDSYSWCIVSLDGVYCHMDILEDLLNGDGLHVRFDDEMEGYYWDEAAYPACPRPEPPEQPEDEAPEEGEAAESQPEQPSEQPEPSGDAAQEPGA